MQATPPRFVVLREASRMADLSNRKDEVSIKCYQMMVLVQIQGFQEFGFGHIEVGLSIGHLGGDVNN